MTGIFKYLLISMILATVAALGAGLFSLLRGGEFNAKYGNRLMRWRVFFQALAVGIFALMLLFKE